MFYVVYVYFSVLLLLLLKTVGPFPIFKPHVLFCFCFGVFEGVVTSWPGTNDEKSFG